MVKIYKNKKEAEEQVEESRHTGWPSASLIKKGHDGWVISAHKSYCKCGMCPVIHTNGYFES